MTPIRVFLRLTAAAVLLVQGAACAPGVTLQQDAPAPAPARLAVEESGKAWWRVYFRLAWDQAQEPEWHIDALLADQVMAPVIAHAEPRLSLWRFHRRAARDEHGHRFSFLFYADPETAEVVNNGVKRSPITARLQQAGIVLEVRLASPEGPPADDIGAASDPAWPAAVMRGWPWFVMGVSQSWLRLIAEAKAARSLPEGAALDEVLAYYRAVHDEVSTLWREHGQHAYLHHLNALFGYQLLIIRETNLKRF